MKQLLQLTLFILLICCSSCVNYSILENKVYDRNSLIYHKTFYIVPSAQKNIPEQMTNADFKIISHAVRNKMYKRGYREKRNDGLKIFIGLTLVPSSSKRNKYYKPKPYYWGAIDSWQQKLLESLNNSYGMNRVGTLSVVMIDTHTKQIVYKGVVGSVVNSKYQMRSKIMLEKAINDLFEQFPISPLY